jgi:hypothetical protein
MARAMRAPAATPPATQSAAWKPLKKAELAAEWTAEARAGWAEWAKMSATLSAPPTELCAVRSNGVGNPAGRVLARRLAYREVKTLPITATPRVPPSNLVASLTAEPTPALALGTTPMRPRWPAR